MEVWWRTGGGAGAGAGMVEVLVLVLVLVLVGHVKGLGLQIVLASTCP